MLKIHKSEKNEKDLFLEHIHTTTKQSLLPIRDGLPKKVAVLLDFVQITLAPLPLIWTTCITFLNANAPKLFGRGLPLPPHPQIDPIYTVCEKWTNIWAGPSPPLIWTKSKRTATFFRETSLTKTFVI